jgi:hypothetical protein
MLIETNQLTFCQLMRVFMAVTEMTHEQVADMLGMPLWTLRGWIRGNGDKIKKQETALILETIMAKELNK